MQKKGEDMVLYVLFWRKEATSFVGWWYLWYQKFQTSNAMVSKRFNHGGMDHDNDNVKNPNWVKTQKQRYMIR
jgi:hypothetical protein